MISKQGLFPIIILLILLVSSNVVWGKTVLYTGDAVVLKVAYMNPSEIRFQGDEIASIVTGIAPQAISMQNTKDTLYIQPLVEDLRGDIYVIMRDGKSKVVSLLPVVAEMRDRKVTVITEDTAIENRLNKINASGVTPAGLIKSMVLKEDVDGVAVTDNVNIPILPDLKLYAKSVYDAVYMKGYVIPITTNFTEKDLKSIIMKGLLAGAIYNNVLYLVINN